MTHASRRPPLQFQEIEDVTTALRAAGWRVSAVRRMILEALFRASGPVSAQFLVEGAGLASLRIDEASAYRNLEKLEELGVVRHVHLGHGPGLYALAHREREHLYCEQCGRVTAVEPTELEPVRKLIREHFGYHARFGHFPIVGLCALCARRPPKVRASRQSKKSKLGVSDRGRLQPRSHRPAGTRHR